MGQGIKVYRSSAGGVLPYGLIALWAGSADAVPDGWALCNGSNGTPDLRDRFVVGAGNSYTVGATGGEAKHTLTVNEMPSHSHSGSGSVEVETGRLDNSTFRGSTGSSTSGLVGAALTISSSWIYNGNLDLSGLQTTSTGGGAAHENRPPYYALCFIMKL